MFGRSSSYLLMPALRRGSSCRSAYSIRCMSRARSPRPAIQMSFSKELSQFPRSALWIVPLPVLLMGGAIVYNVQQAIGVYYNQSLEYAIDDFRMWSQLMRMSAIDPEAAFFELDDETGEMLHNAARSQAINFDCSNALLDAGFLQVIREAASTSFDEVGSTEFIRAKACAVRVQAWKFLRSLTAPGANPRVFDMLLEDEFKPLLESLVALDRDDALDEISAKMAVLVQLNAHEGHAERMGKMATIGTVRSAIAVLFNVVQAAAEGRLDTNLNSAWERSTCRWLCQEYHVASRKASEMTATPEQATSMIEALPHLRWSMRLLATLSQYQHICTGLALIDQGRIAYFGIALAGELQGRAGDELSFEAGRFLANMSKNCLESDELPSDCREEMGNLLDKFGRGRSSQIRGLELGLPRVPGLSLRFDPNTTDFKTISNGFTFMSLGVDGFLYGFVRSVVAMRQYYAPLSASAGGLGLRLCSQVALRASLGSMAIYFLHEYDDILGRKMIPPAAHSDANFQTGLAIQAADALATAAILRVAPFSFGAVVIHMMHDAWRRHFKLIDE